MPLFACPRETAYAALTIAATSAAYLFGTTENAPARFRATTTSATTVNQNSVVL